MSTATDEDYTSLLLLIHGFQLSRMIRLAADLGMADHVPLDDRISVASLAARCGRLYEPLLRLCRALASFGIFTLDSAGMIGHSPRSMLLRSDSTRSLHHAARFRSATGSWEAWAALDHALLTGASPFEMAWNAKRFDYMQAHPEELRLYDDHMASERDNRHGGVAATYDFRDVPVIADIGGGNGALLRAILTRHTAPRGLVFDRHDVVAAIPPEARLDGRIAVAGGDFFEEVPCGADLYLLSFVLHDWSDDDCLRILRNCRRAMRQNTRLLVIERILQPDPACGDPLDYLTDMQMMVVFQGGRERTLPEFQRLLDETGFGPARITRTASPVWIIEAEAID